MRLQPFLALAFLVAASAEASAFELNSPDIVSGETIAEAFVHDRFGCAGANLSPTLSWSDPPAGTKSFAVSVLDPDAPKPGGFWHWMVYDVPASVESLAQGVGKDEKGLPEGARAAKNDFGDPGYGGPCPPRGDKPHHYRFTLYALKVDKLDLPPHVSASLAESLVKANSLAEASLIATYGR